MRKIVSNLNSFTNSDLGNCEPQKSVESDAHRVAKIGADVVVEIIDAAPGIAKTASMLSSSLPLKNVWIRHGLAVALLGIVGFSVLAVASLKGDHVDIEGKSPTRES